MNGCSWQVKICAFRRRGRVPFVRIAAICVKSAAGYCPVELIGDIDSVVSSTVKSFDYNQIASGLPLAHTCR